MKFLKVVTSQGIDPLQRNSQLRNSQSVQAVPNNRGDDCKQLKKITPSTASLYNIQEVGAEPGLSG